jgi:hypothetical protein
MKSVARVLIFLVAMLLFLIGGGAALDHRELERAVGPVIQILSVFLVLVVFFHWRRTAVTGPSQQVWHVRVLAAVLVAAGLLAIISLQAILSLGVFGEGGVGRAFRTISVERFGLLGSWIVFTFAASQIVAGIGLFLDRTWGRFLAKSVTLIGASAFPFGLALATYAWWALNPNPRSA